MGGKSSVDKSSGNLKLYNLIGIQIFLLLQFHCLLFNFTYIYSFFVMISSKQSALVFVYKCMTAVFFIINFNTKLLVALKINAINSKHRMCSLLVLYSTLNFYVISCYNYFNFVAIARNALFIIRYYFYSKNTVLKIYLSLVLYLQFTIFLNISFIVHGYE